MRGPCGKLWTEVFSFLLRPKREARGTWKQGRKKRESITCRTDRANEANKMFIIWLCWLFRFWKDDRELEIRTATYVLGIDQSQLLYIHRCLQVTRTVLPWSCTGCSFPLRRDRWWSTLKPGHLLTTVWKCASTAAQYRFVSLETYMWLRDKE